MLCGVTFAPETAKCKTQNSVIIHCKCLILRAGVPQEKSGFLIRQCYTGMKVTHSCHHNSLSYESIGYFNCFYSFRPFPLLINKQCCLAWTAECKQNIQSSEQMLWTTISANFQLNQIGALPPTIGCLVSNKSNSIFEYLCDIVYKLWLSVLVLHLWLSMVSHPQVYCQQWETFEMKAGVPLISPFPLFSVTRTMETLF